MSSRAPAALSPAQPELDFEHALPAGIHCFPRSVLATTWSCDPDHVQHLIECGALRTAVDLCTAEASRARLRIPRAAVTQFLDARRAGGAATPPVERLDFRDLLPPGRAFLRAYEIARYLRCTTPHIVNLIDEGALPHAVDLHVSSRSMWSVTRAALAEFLNSRRLP